MKINNEKQLRKKRKHDATKKRKNTHLKKSHQNRLAYFITGKGLLFFSGIWRTLFRGVYQWHVNINQLRSAGCASKLGGPPECRISAGGLNAYHVGSLMPQNPQDPPSLPQVPENP